MEYQYRRLLSVDPRPAIRERMNLIEARRLLEEMLALEVRVRKIERERLPREYI